MGTDLTRGWNTLAEIAFIRNMYKRVQLRNPDSEADGYHLKKQYFKILEGYISSIPNRSNWAHMDAINILLFATRQLEEDKEAFG